MAADALLADFEIARIAHEAVRHVDGVASLSHGRYARIGTFGAAGIIPGIVVRTDPHDGSRDLDAHVNVKYVPLADLASRIRSAIAAALAKHDVALRNVDVFIDGMED